MAFSGGYRFNHFEGAASPRLAELALPLRIVFPLEHPVIHSYTPTFADGALIRAGETLFIRSGTPHALPAPLSGRVERTATTLVIVGDGSTGFSPVSGHPREPWHLNRRDLFNLFTRTGCDALFGGRWTDESSCDTISDIIINTVHSSPLSREWIPDLYGDGGLTVNGFKTLRALFPKALIHLAATRRISRMFDDPELLQLATLRVVSDRYPQEHPALLARDILGRPVETEAATSNSGILFAGYTDVVQLAEVMSTGRPLIDRILCIAGPGVSRPGWYRVRIGTSFDFIRQTVGKSDEFGPWRYIDGNPLSGRGLESLDEPVFYNTNELSIISEYAVRDLFRFLTPGFAADSYARATVSSVIPLVPRKLETNVHGGVRPCVQCNFCDEVCPVSIYPFLIWKYMAAGKPEETFRLKPDACIECGLCDYVCPSKIALRDGVEKAKTALADARRSDADTH